MKTAPFGLLRRLTGSALVLFLLLSAYGIGHAQQVAQPDKVRAEVSALMEVLASSGCEFQRNGSWYSAGEARSHLGRKLDYMMEREPPTSAEQFVDLAASRSSMSGRAYMVRCPAKEAVPSRDWLMARLAQVRLHRSATGRH